MSWQFHHRRAEIWRVIKGQAGVVRSNSDSENELEILNFGTMFTLKQGDRHHLVGREDYSVVAEIWYFTYVANLSDEKDIMRLHDDLEM